jgi:hypothetical protein
MKDCDNNFVEAQATHDVDDGVRKTKQPRIF